MYLDALGLSCAMWDLVPRPGIKPRPPALGVWSLSHWTTREAPQGSGFFFLTFCKYLLNVSHDLSPVRGEDSEAQGS